MALGFLKKNDSVGVLIIAGSCCVPGMAPLDEQARKTVEQAVSETGVKAVVKVVMASSAMFGGVPMGAMGQLISIANKSGQMPVPAVLINGKLVCYGVPNIEDIKAALQDAATKRIKEAAREQRPESSSLAQ